MSLLEKFIAFDDSLAIKGVPPCTEWWRTGLREWFDAYENRQVLDLWVCVGRGAAKSTVLYKLALFFALFGDFQIPPGEVHYAIVLSRLVDEAKKGIHIIARWCDLLGVPHRLAGEVIEFDKKPRGIRVVAASVAASSGWRAFFIAKDERSKWPMGGVEDLDSEEIDVSSVAMTATHALAPTIAAGSAWGTFGKFFDAIMKGTTDDQMVIGPTPTWVAAPHVSIESLKRKFRDPKMFAREAACIFQSGATSAIDPDLVRRAQRPMRHGKPLGDVVIGMDSSALRGDPWTWLCGQWWQPELRETDIYEHDLLDDDDCLIVFRQDACGNRIKKAEIERPRPEFCVFNINAVAADVSAEEIISRVASTARQHGAKYVFSDSYQQFFITAALAKKQLAHVVMHWSAETKVDGLARLRSLLHDGALAIQPSHEGKLLAEELIGLQEVIRPSGSIGLGARRGRHDDRAASLLNLMMADAEGALNGAIQRRHGENMVGPYGRRFAEVS